jgi:hypothetical protein
MVHYHQFLKEDFFKKIINVTDTKTKTNQEYKIISYDSAYLNNDQILTYGVFRSVVVNSLNDVVSFFPSKKMKFSLITDNKNYLFENHVMIITHKDVKMLYELFDKLKSNEISFLNYFNSSNITVNEILNFEY